MRLDSNQRSPACRAGTLPLSYASKVERPVGIEPTYSAWKAGAFAARPRTHVEPDVGIEPTTTCLQNRGSATELNGHFSELVSHALPILH